MKVQTNKLEALTIIEVEGELVNDLAPIFDAVKTAEEGHKNIILDLTSISSFGDLKLEILEEVAEFLDLSEKSFVICGVNNELQMALDKKFEEDFFNIVPTRNEAVDMVYMEEQERSFFN
jgi:anti-anti-sigma regulatory factor